MTTPRSHTADRPSASKTAATSSDRGADLNRNFVYNWGCCGGSSSQPCDFTYRGPGPASEPETQAVQNYLLAQFPDQRGPGESTRERLNTVGRTPG